jgi:hypothetical protein
MTPEEWLSSYLKCDSGVYPDEFKDDETYQYFTDMYLKNKTEPAMINLETVQKFNFDGIN